MHEIKSINLKTPKADKPFFDNRDMCGFMCVICAALITYLFFTNGFVIYYSKWQLGGTIVSFIFLVSVVLFWSTQKIVRFCSKRAKRKADTKVDQSNKNSIK